MRDIEKTLEQAKIDLKQAVMRANNINIAIKKGLKFLYKNVI